MLHVHIDEHLKSGSGHRIIAKYVCLGHDAIQAFALTQLAGFDCTINGDVCFAHQLGPEKIISGMSFEDWDKFVGYPISGYTIIDRNGERTWISQEIDETELFLDSNQIKEGDIVYCDAYRDNLQLPEEVANQAQSMKCRLYVNFGDPMLHAVSLGSGYCDRILEASEWIQLSDRHDKLHVEALRELSEEYMTSIILTRGPNGAKLIKGREVFDCRPVSIKSVHSTASAGAYFSAAFICASALRYSARKCLKTAVNTATELVYSKQRARKELIGLLNDILTSA